MFTCAALGQRNCRIDLETGGFGRSSLDGGTARLSQLTEVEGPSGMYVEIVSGVRQRSCGYQHCKSGFSELLATRVYATARLETAELSERSELLMQVHEPIQGLSTGPRRVYVRLGIAVSVEMTMLGSTLHAVAALALLSTTSLALAQTDAVRNQQGLKHDFAADRLLVDAATLETVNDPAAADVLFREGTPILAILKDLTEKGFHIKYKEKHFLPTMTLVRLPESTRIDKLLREILEPWNFRVNRTPVGHWIVRPNKKKRTPAPMDETHEELRELVRERDGAG